MQVAPPALKNIPATKLLMKTEPWNWWSH